MEFGRFLNFEKNNLFNMRFHSDFCLLLSVVLIFATVQLVFSKEPAYNGKPLSEWICCGSPNEQNEAILHIGADAVPILIHLLGSNDKDMKQVAARLESSGLREMVANDDESTITGIRETVSQAFGTLGTNAEFAIPQLIKILDSDDDDVSPYAASALGQIGPKGIEALTNALCTAEKPSTRQNIAIGLGQNGVNSNDATQLLVRLLKDKSSDVRRIAATYLGTSDGKIVIPALIPLLDDGDPLARQAAAVTLGSYGAQAKILAPKLLTLYTNNPDPSILESLKKIDLETAKNAELLLVNSEPINPLRLDYISVDLKTGLKLIAGGYYRAGLFSATNILLSKAELYDPKTRHWIETGEMKTPRFGGIAILLQNGKVLVAGGEGAEGALSSAELYDPVVGGWVKTGSLKKPHAGGKAFLKSDGKVIIYSGGWSPRVLPFNQETFNPIDGTWMAIPNK